MVSQKIQKHLFWGKIGCLRVKNEVLLSVLLGIQKVVVAPRTQCFTLHKHLKWGAGVLMQHFSFLNTLLMCCYVADYLN